MRAAAAEVMAIAKSAVTASVAEPLKTCLCIGLLRRCVGSANKTPPPTVSASALRGTADGDARASRQLPYHQTLGAPVSRRPPYSLGRMAGYCGVTQLPSSRGTM